MKNLIQVVNVHSFNFLNVKQRLQCFFLITLFVLSNNLGQSQPLSVPNKLESFIAIISEMRHRQTLTVLHDSIVFKGHDSILKFNPLSYQLDTIAPTSFEYSRCKPIDSIVTIKKVGQNVTIWVKLEVFNTEKDISRLYFNFGTHEMSRIYKYNKNNELVLIGSLGTLKDKNKKDSIYLQEAILIELAPQDTTILVIELDQINYEYLKRDITPTFYQSKEELRNTYNANQDQHRFRTMLHLFLLGFYVFQIIWITFQCIQLRRREYFYYLAYIVTLIIYFFSKIEAMDGLDFFFTYYPSLHVYLNKSFPLFAYLMYYRFFDKFFDIAGERPRLRRYMFGFELLMIGALIADVLVMFFSKEKPVDLAFVDFS